MDTPNDRFLRAMGIMDHRGLKKIQDTSIAIGGLGLGGSIFINLVRLGFEKFHIADPDIYERTNVNRQRLAKESTLGFRKADILIQEAFDINPNVQIKKFSEGVSQNNVKAFLEGISWVVDIIDVFALNEKLTLHEEATRRGLPIATCGALGFSSAVVIFDKTTPTFSELSGLTRTATFETNIRNFAHFICPEIPDYMQAQFERAMQRQSHFPFVVPGVEFTAACAATEIAKQVLNLGKVVRAPYGIYIDPVNLNIQLFEASYLRGKNQFRKAA